MYDPERAIEREKEANERWAGHEKVRKRNKGKDNLYIEWHRRIMEKFDILDQIESDIENCFDPTQREEYESEFDKVMNSIKDALK